MRVGARRPPRRAPPRACRGCARRAAPWRPPRPGLGPSPRRCPTTRPSRGRFCRPRSPLEGWRAPTTLPTSRLITPVGRLISPETIFGPEILTTSSASSRLRILPAGLRGSSSTKTTSRGTLKRARFSLMKDLTSSSRSSRLGHEEHPQPLAVLLVRNAHRRGLLDVLVRGEQLLDLAREDVLAARDDHLVVAPVHEQAAGLVEVADVAGRHEPVDDLLGAAARVALERRAHCRRRCGRSRPAGSIRRFSAS